MNPIRINDHMVTNDDLIITNRIKKNSECAAPHGRLFQVLDIDHTCGRRIVREIACNTVVVGGAILALENITGATASWKPKTLNDIHNVNAGSLPAGVTPKLALFGIGTGGANLEFGSVISPDIKQHDILNPIPIRYGAAVTGDDSANYFMKQSNGESGTYSWYLKKFTGDPVIKSCWKDAISSEEDGTVIATDIHGSDKTEGIETFTEIQIDLNTLDGREYFEATKVANPRYNTIGFYTGSLNEAGTEYGDVRLYSAVSFNNRDLTISSKSQFIYRIYSLI